MADRLLIVEDERTLCESLKRVFTREGYEVDTVVTAEEGLKKLQGEVVHWANKGRYTKVRFKFRGKQLLPDIPLAATREQTRSARKLV